jgi:membrane protein implicated in regulation of membrane protease activity
MAAGYIFASMTLVLTFVMIISILTYVLYRTIRKTLLKRKMKRYDLNKYDIIFSSGSLPVCLISRENKNEIIFL